MNYRATILAAVLVALPAAASAQPDGAAPRLWASDRAAADADLANGQYQDALALYAHAIAAAEAGPQDAAARAAIGSMLLDEGNCLLKLHRTEEAEAAYEKAAPLSPDPVKAYFNLCATYYNNGATASALAACDKAIEREPAKADAYFIKGSLLFGEAQFTGGKYAVPPGTVEALDKYLELAPDGSHASDVQQMLAALK